MSENFGLVSEYFELKNDYENKRKIESRNAKNNNREYKEKCIFCNQLGGTSFIQTSDKFIIKCKENKCNEVLEYKKKPSINIDELIELLDVKKKDLQKELRMKILLSKYNIDDSINDDDLLSLNESISNIEHLKENYLKMKLDLEKLKENEIKVLEERKLKLLEDLDDYKNNEFINYKSLVESSNEIKDIDENILNIKYEVQNVEESRDGINPKIVSEDVNKYPCKESDGMNVILKKYCLETLETELFDNF